MLFLITFFKCSWHSQIFFFKKGPVDTFMPPLGWEWCKENLSQSWNTLLTILVDNLLRFCSAEALELSLTAQDTMLHQMKDSCVTLA